ncbi:MAG: TRAP transporter small permease [Veillonellaceae bacterium]|nr:TRAP transporter small permease [Veillonellaceae bacterium]
MGQINKLISSVSNGIDRAMVGMVFLIMAALVIVTTMQVVFRVAFTALTWSEELSRYLLVWGTFFGATLAYKRGNHIAVTFVIDFFPARLRTGFNVLIYLLSLVFFVVVAQQGVNMIKMQVFQISPALGLPMKYIYWSIPFSLAIMILHALAGIMDELHKAFGKGAAE